jgi:hypothetical protein
MLMVTISLIEVFWGKFEGFFNDMSDIRNNDIPEVFGYYAKIFNIIDGS